MVALGVSQSFPTANNLITAAGTGSLMTHKQIAVCERLKRLGYSPGNRMRLYGQEFQLTSEPVTVRDDVVFVDGIESRSGQVQRIRIPLPTIRMLHRDLNVA